MPFVWTKNGAESKVFTWLDTAIIGRREWGPIIVQTRATQQEGVLERSWKPQVKKLKSSECRQEWISVAVRNATNSSGCPWGAETEWWEPLFTGRNAVSTGRLGRMELDEFIKRSAVSPSCHPSPCSQTPINVRNTSKTTFSTRPRKQGYI